MLKTLFVSLCGGLLISGSAFVNAAPPAADPALQPAPAPQPQLAPNVQPPANNPNVQQPVNPNIQQPADPNFQQPAAGQPANAQPQGQQQNAPVQLFRAKQVLGAKVQLSGNVSAGTVDDFVVDENGYVEYVIVNNNNQFVTVPWDATVFNFEKQTAVINIPQEQFQKIPTYTAEKYPVFSEPQYRTTVYRYYGLTPRERPRLFPRLGR